MASCPQPLWVGDVVPHCRVGDREGGLLFLRPLTPTLPTRPAQAGSYGTRIGTRHQEL